MSHQVSWGKGTTTECIPLVDLKAQYRNIKSEVDAAIQRVLSHTGFILGEEVANFEQAFAAYVGAKAAVGVASGTAALHLALLACGVGPGDEVITTAHTFMATAEAISQTGAQPVFVDINPKTYTLDPDQVKVAITPKTRAVIPVHLYGHPAEMDVFLDVSRRYGLWLIEDAAQAHGAKYKGRRCGSMGDLACFSFYPGKNLGAYGDAGAVTGNDGRLLERVRRLRDHGRVGKYEHESLGYGERLDAIHAAILSAKLPHLETWNEARRSLAQRYNDLLAGCGGVTVPYETPWVCHVYHAYVVRVPHRDEVLKRLKARGVSAGIHYPIPLHRQPAYVSQGYGEVSLPVTEQVANEVLSLPIYPELSREQQDYVVSVLREVVE